MKNMAKTIVFLAFALLFVGFSVQAQTKILKNIGFVQDNIWYSKDPFFNGDKIRIYTAVLNSSQYDFKGILEFFAGGKSVGKSSFSLVSGGFQVLWADWTAEGGSRKIYANIVEAKISLPGGVEEVVVLENAKTGEIETFVDADTDKDGIGDKLDFDDDNDTISDVEETKKGTDPLVKNTVSSGAVAQKQEEVKKQIIPEPKQVAESAKGAIASINNFLDEQKEKAEAKKEEIQKQLGDESLFSFDFGNKSPAEVGVTAPLEDGAEENKNLLKLYALALSALVFSLEYKVIIYLFGIYIGYRILKLFIRKLFFRRGLN